MSVSNILLTGQPGSGKTTVLQQVLENAGFSAGGFLTTEIRRGNQRVGFTLDTLDNQRGILAHIDLPDGPRVGKYRVDISGLEKVGVAGIKYALQNCEVVVIDEIGKMELLSELFQSVVETALSAPKPVLGTIIQGKHPVADEIKNRQDVSVFTVNEETRSYLAVEIQLQLKRILSFSG